MIVVDLQCERGHGFEGWFASSAAFEEQLARGQVSCPDCGALRVLRRPSAPYVRTRSAVSTASAAPEPAAIEALTERILAHLRNSARGFEDVGEQFADEARRIHNGEAEMRGIKGRASGDDVRELLDEGIGVLPVPPDEEFH